MEIKIKKIKNDNASAKLDSTKKPRKRTKKIAKDKKTVSTGIQQDETKIVDTYVTETLSDIEANVMVDEKANEVEMSTTPAMDIDFLEWEYRVKEKSFWFYLLLFGLAVGSIYFSYKYNNWMLALIVILGFVMISQKNAKVEDFRIDKSGVYIQNQQINWTNIISCGIETLNESTLLMTVISKTVFHSKIYIPFDKSRQREVLYLINKYSTFVNHKSSVFNQIIKWIIF